MSAWRKYRTAILSTIGGIGIWIAAIFCHQPIVNPPSIPLWHSGINEWTLTNDYQTAVAVSGVTYTVSIKSGFKSDGVSISKVLQWPLGLTRDSPSIIRGAICHDAIYAAHLLNKQIADSILYAACLQDGTAPDKAMAVYEAVHDWGFIAWDGYSRAEIAAEREMVKITIHP